MQKTAIIMDYENVMIHKKSSKNYQIVQYHDEKSEGPKNATILLRYIFENILEWTPQMVRDYLNKDIVDWLNLSNAIKEIPFPPELTPSKDFFYIASFLYPKTVPYNKRDAVLRIYLREIRSKSPKFPVGFFKNKDGKENFNICLRYVLSENFFASTNKDIYNYFSDQKKAKAFFNHNLLLKPCMLLYDSPQEAVHEALPDGDKNELFYHYNTLKAYLGAKNKNMTLEPYPDDYESMNNHLLNVLKSQKIKIKLKEIKE